MVKGSIDSNGDATVPLRLYGAGAMFVEIVAVVDTGFTESLSLPTEIIELLGSERVEETPYVFGDGSVVDVDVYAVQIEWFGRRKRVLALQLEGSPLIGMTMLRGMRLTLEIEKRGKVQIERL
jgi:clan AA aspartic protease